MWHFKCPAIIGGLALLPVGLVGGATLPRQTAIEVALPWLAASGMSPTEIPTLSILRFDCSSCLDRLEAALDGRKGLPLIYFDYGRPEERRLAQLLVAAALSAVKPEEQAKGFRTALRFYLLSPSEHLAHPEKFAALIEPQLTSSAGRTRALAQALNRLDQQQMVMGLMGVTRTPVDLPLPHPELTLPRASSVEDKLIPLRDRRIGLASLAPQSPAGENSVLLRVALSPEQRLPAAVWRQLAGRLSTGLAWHWLTEEGDQLPPSFTAWHRRVLAFPEDSARLAAFQVVLNKLADTSGQDRSFVDEAISPVNSLDESEAETNARQLDWILKIMRINEALTPSQ
jgi:hypothetical protein